MFVRLRNLLGWVVSAFRSREELPLENLALRQQPLALHAKRPRPRLSSWWDRSGWGTSTGSACTAEASRQTPTREGTLQKPRPRPAASQHVLSCAESAAPSTTGCWSRATLSCPLHLVSFPCRACPMRWARSTACASTAGFHSEPTTSRKIARRLPPHLNLPRGPLPVSLQADLSP